MILNKNSLYNLPVGIQALMTGTTVVRPAFATDMPIKRPEAALAGVVMVLPVVIMFLLSQRFVISGALTGAAKE